MNLHFSRLLSDPKLFGNLAFFIMGIFFLIAAYNGIINKTVSISGKGFGTGIKKDTKEFKSEPFTYTWGKLSVSGSVAVIVGYISLIFGIYLFLINLYQIYMGII